MKENPIIVPVQLTKSKQFESSQTEAKNLIPSCYFKMNKAEVTFYNGVDKYILHAVLAGMSKYAR